MPMEKDVFDVDELLKEIERAAREQADEESKKPEENTPAPVNAESTDAQEAAPQEPTESKPESKKAKATKTDDKPKSGKKKKKKGKKKKKKSPFRKFLSFLGKTILVLVQTALLLVMALYGVMYVLVEGPSPTARDIFVMSVRETSAMYWLADLFLTPEEIAAIEAGGGDVEEFVETDTSLIQIQKPQENPEETGEPGQEQQNPAADAWGLVDEDGDGIIVEAVHGEGFSGYMMVVLDPSRVIMGSVPSSYGGRGYTVADMVAKFDAVAGINAGGFEDPDGKGNGSIPNTMVVYEGKVYYAEKGVQDGFVGFDADHIMHVGKLKAKDIKEKNIQYGVSFGPVLISNGEPAGH